MAADETHRRGTLPLYALVALYLAALTTNVCVFWVLPSGSTLERLAFSLQLLGVYNLALTFLATTDLFKTFPTWLDEMTSANLRDFSAAVLRTLAVIASLSSLAIRGFPPPLVTRRLPLLLQVLVVVTLGLLFVIVDIVLFVLVAVVLVLGIAPIAYIGYVLVGVLLDSISTAPADVSLSSANGSLSLQGSVRAHEAQLRTLLVGLPATALGVATAGYALFT
jgi:hypothetical protein